MKYGIALSPWETFWNYFWNQRGPPPVRLHFIQMPLIELRPANFTAHMFLLEVTAKCHSTQEFHK